MFPNTRSIVSSWWITLKSNEVKQKFLDRHRRSKKPTNLLHIFLIAFLITTYVFLLSFYISHRDGRYSDSKQVSLTEPAKSTEKVSRVIDGDTFEIQGGIKVRLIGVDTPEMKNKNKTIDCFAAEATKKTQSLLTGKEVVLEKDVSETDKYGRLLRYVYLDDEMVNDTLVKEGYAKISTFPPDVKNAQIFLASEKLARENKAGLWQACK